MNWCGIPGARAETCGNLTPDLAIAAGLIVQTPFKHSQDNVIITYYEPLNFRRLAFGQPNTICLPSVAHTSGQAGQDGMNGTVKARINVEHELTEIRKPCRA